MHELAFVISPREVDIVKEVNSGKKVNYDQIK